MTRDRMMFLATLALLLAWILSGSASPDAINVAYRTVNYDGNGNVTVPGGVNLPAGQQLGFSGPGGTTYLVGNGDTGCIEQWKNNKLGWQMCDGGVIPPDCPTDTSAFGFGEMCKDQISRHLRVHVTSVETF